MKLPSSFAGVKLVKKGSDPRWLERSDFAAETLVIVGLPGAYTPVCSSSHVPGFLEKADEFKARGASVFILSTNDAYALGAWAEDLAKSTGRDWGKLSGFLADGNASLVRALHIDKDMSEKGMGIRSRRCALVFRDGALAHAFIEANPDDLIVSKAEFVLEHMDDPVSTGGSAQTTGEAPSAAASGGGGAGKGESTHRAGQWVVPDVLKGGP